jgi:hypothetical protein
MSNPESENYCGRLYTQAELDAAVRAARASEACNEDVLALCTLVTGYAGDPELLKQAREKARLIGARARKIEAGEL